LESIAGMMLEEASMLKKELSRVVSGNSTRKGKINGEQAVRTIANRSKNRTKK
jgi:hypothetical protein